MNINTKTGKVWVNNYMQMYGTLFSNQKHPYIQLYRYYDTIGRLEGRTKTAYAMILHSHLAQIMCNRSPGIHANIFMYIDTDKGYIANSKEMKEFMLKEGFMNCNGSHLLDIASQEVWWLIYKNLIDLGLLTQSTGVLRVMVPIEGRMLPIPYAYVAFLSRLKKDSALKSEIQKAMSDIPDKVRTNLENLPKEDLINELLKYKIHGVDLSRKGDMFKTLFEEVRAKNPHKWGYNIPEKKPENNPEKFLENFVENFSEKKSEIFSEKNPEKKSEKFPGEFSPEELSEEISEKISENNSQKKYTGNIKKVPVKDLDEISKQEFPTKGRPKSTAPKIPQSPEENQSIEELIVFADDTNINDLKKIQKKNPELFPEDFSDDESKKYPDLDDFDIDADDIDDIPNLPRESVDIFGLPVNSEYDCTEEDLPEIPENVENQEDIPDNEFWGY